MIPARLHRALLRVFAVLPPSVRRAVVHLAAPSFTVGAICVIERADGAILLVRQVYREQWGMPGGLLKRGEDVHDGARRETLEEVGLHIETVGEPVVVVAPGPRRVDVVYRCRVVGEDEPVASSPEILEVRWFPAEELPPLQHEASGALVALNRSALA